MLKPFVFVGRSNHHVWIVFHFTSAIPSVWSLWFHHVNHPEFDGCSRKNPINILMFVKSSHHVLIQSVGKDPYPISSFEILHQLIGDLSHYLQALTIQGGAGFLPQPNKSHQIHSNPLSLALTNPIKSPWSLPHGAPRVLPRRATRSSSGSAWRRAGCWTMSWRWRGRWRPGRWKNT